MKIKWTAVSISHFMGSIALAFMIALGLGCQSNLPDMASLEQSVVGHPEYTLGPGDKVKITVYTHEDLSGIFSVDSAGRISLPLIQGIKASGLTLIELEKTISEQLIVNYIADPKVSADLLELRAYCVFGEVERPGCFPFVYGMNAAKAIATAGGYTYRAKVNKFVVTRDDGRKVAGNHEVPVFPGDTIEIYERFF